MKITKEERHTIKYFNSLRYPSEFYYRDDINLLYVEHLDFDICDDILRKRKYPRDKIEREKKYYNNFINGVKIDNLSEYGKDYIDLIKEVMNIFLKYNNNM